MSLVIYIQDEQIKYLSLFSDKISISILPNFQIKSITSCFKSILFNMEHFSLLTIRC